MFFKNFKNGFTMLEIVVVLIIAGMISAMALPRLYSLILRFRAREGEVALLALCSAQKRYYTDYGVFTSDIDKLDVTFPGLNNFDYPVIDSNEINAANAINFSDDLGDDDNEYENWLEYELGSIQYSSGTYTLFIRNNGEIFCDDSFGDGYGDDVGCERMKY